VGLRVTWSRSLSAEDAEAWDAFVDGAPSGAYAQARSYAALAIAGRAFTPRFFIARDTERDGSIVGAALVLRARGPAGIPLPAAVVERGPVCSLSDLRRVVTALRRTALRHGVARLVVMPYFAEADAATAEEILASCKFRLAHDFSSAHARTLRIALGGKSKADLFAGKEGKTVRQEVKNAEKAGAKTRRATKDDVPAFERLYTGMMAQQDRGTKARAFFRALGERLEREPTRASLWITELGDDVVSVAYVARHGKIATYVMGASDAADRPFTKAAPAIAAAATWALEEGCDVFDLGGIPMEGDTDEKRKSIAAFKLKFAKTPVTLVREHARWL
jgi:lipid II:glycine glycyltransferase (peptidoglycan interpeptide bridge formation enzyme)